MAKFGLGVGAEKGNIIGYTKDGEPVYQGDMRGGNTADPEQLRPLEPVAKAIREGDAKRYGAPVGRNSLSEALPPMPTRGMGAAKANGGRYSDKLPPMPEPLGGPAQTPGPSYPDAETGGYGRAGAGAEDMAGGLGVAPTGATGASPLGTAPIGAKGTSPLGNTPDPLGSIEDEEGSNAGLYGAGAGATGLASVMAQRRNKKPPTQELLAGTSGYGGEMSPLGRETAGRPLKGGAVGKAKLDGIGAGRGDKSRVSSEGKPSQLGEGQKVLPGGKNLPGSPKSRVSGEGKPLQLGEGQKVLPGSASKKALPGGKTPLQLTDPNAPIDLSFLDGEGKGYMPHKLTQPEDTIRFDPYSGPMENDAGAVFDAAAKGSKSKTPAFKPSAKDPMAATSDRLGNSRALKDNVNAHNYVGSKQKGGYLSTDAGKGLSSSVEGVVDAMGSPSKSAMGASIGAEGEYLKSARSALQSLGKTAKASQIAEALAPHVIPVLKAHFTASNAGVDAPLRNPDVALRSVQSELRNIYGKGKPQAEIDAVAAKLAKLLMGRR